MKNLTFSLIVTLAPFWIAAQHLEVEGKAIIIQMDTINSAQDSTAGNVLRLSDGTLALRQYKIGDMAHGGIVFWVDETGEHGLVCSKADLESIPGDSLHQWSTANVVSGATGGTVADGSFDGKGAGAMNTMLSFQMIEQILIQRSDSVLIW